MNELSLIYTVHKFNKNEISNIIYIQRKLQNMVNLVVLSDNKDINSKIYNAINGTGISFVPSNGNVGKYQLVKNYLKNTKNQTKWIKMVDPDDYILVDNLKDFIEFLRSNKFSGEELFFLNPAKRVQSGEWDIKKINDEAMKIEEKELPSNTFVNENTVLPWKSISDFKLDAYGQTKSSDVLFSLSYFYGEFQTNVVTYNKTFYIYNFRNGITSTSVYDKDMFNEFINFLKIMIKYRDKNPMPIPSMFDYYWAHNVLCESELDSIEREKEMNNVFNLLKESSNLRKIKASSWDDIEFNNLRSKLAAKEKLDLLD